MSKENFIVAAVLSLVALFGGLVIFFDRQRISLELKRCETAGGVYIELTHGQSLCLAPEALKGEMEW